MTTSNFPPPAAASPLRPPPAHGALAPAGAPHHAPRHAPLTLGAFLRILRASRAFILITAATAALAAVGIVLLLPRTYTAAATFVLQGSKGGGGLAGLASQFGVSVAPADVWQQPNFYIDLLKSRTVLEAVAGDSVCDPCGRGASMRPLAERLGITERDPARRRAAVGSKVQRLTEATASPRTGLVTLRVKSKSPWLAQQIADRFLAELTRFNYEARRAQAIAERQFAEQRMQDVAAELRGAEARLQAFYRTNRSYENSPELRFAENRLRRDVALQQDVYTALARSFEQARLDEVRDLPVLVVVDRAAVPPWPDERKLPLFGVLGAVTGLLVGVGLSLGRALLPQLQDDGAP